jgi:hypothetical protein
MSAMAQDATPGARHACPTAHNVLTLHLIDRAGLSTETRQALMREAVLPWREAGLDVRWAADDLDATGGPEHVYVTLTRDAALGGRGGTSPAGRPLAAILFVGGRPTTQISAYVTEIERVAATARIDERPWPELPGLLRERSIGRALGRAIAHEVGHYVFASAAHAPRGLMRAQHPIERLLTSSGASFQVILP